jgi:hypothetical protein
MRSGQAVRVTPEFGDAIELPVLTADLPEGLAVLPAGAGARSLRAPERAELSGGGR